MVINDVECVVQRINGQLSGPAEMNLEQYYKNIKYIQ
jgi:hypothetical protein